MRKAFRRTAFGVFALAAMACGWGGAARAADPMVRELSKQKLPPLSEPAIETKTLANGVLVYYLRDTELPVFRMAARFETGSNYDTEATRGLASFFMSAWRSGGAKGLPSKDIDEKLDFFAATISAGAGAELSSFDVTCLMKDVGEILPVYFKLMREPAFEDERVEVLRKGELNAIKRRNEEPMQIASREFRQSLYGEKSPYAWLSNEETIGRIDRAALEKFHADNIAPNRMRIAATSPLSFDEFLSLIGPSLADWKKELPKKEPPAPVVKEWRPSAEFIQKEGNQSAILAGHFGEKRFNPDKYKLTLANEVLGGVTFGSKLGDRIRTDLGLAYGVTSGFGFDTDYGMFVMATRTKSESTLRTLDEMRRILGDMVGNANITSDELELARERILNRLVFEYESPYNIVTMRLTYDYHGYPPNYLAVYQKEIEAVTLEQVKEALKKYFFPDRLKILIVGDRAGITDLNRLEGLVEKPLDTE